MLIDFQLGIDSLLTVVRNELRQSLHFCTDPVQMGGLGAVYLDHVEVPTASGFPDGQLPFATGFVRRSSVESENLIAHGWKPAFGDPVTEFSDLPNYDPEIVVPLRLHITTDYAIQNGYEAITSDGLVIRLIFVVHGDMLRNEFDDEGNQKPWEPKVSIQVTGIDFGLLADQMPLDDQQKILSKVLGKSVSLPVTLQPIKTLLKNKIPLEVFNVGVSIDVPQKGSGHATRLALRWEVNGPADSLGGWSSFLNGDLGPGLSGANGCRLSVPAGLLTAWSEAMFSEELEGKASKPDAEFDVTTWPTTVWWPGAMLTSFEIDVHVPICPDIGVSVEVATIFSLDQGALLAVSTITHDANDWDVFLCSTLGPTKLFDAIAAGIAADVYEPGLTEMVGNLPSGCVWSKEDEEITCTYPLALPFGDVAATITQLLPTFDGLFLDGVADVQETAASTPWFNPQPTLGWTKPGPCDDFPPYVELPLASIYPGKICAFSVVDDSVNQFTPFVSSNGHQVVLHLPIGGIVGGTEAPSFVEVGEPAWPAGWYFSDPYPLKVVIRTTDGIRLVTSTNVLPLPPKPPELTPLEEIELAASKKLNCQTWAVWQPEQIFKFRWWPDPPWDKVIQEGVNEHLWRVLVSNVAAGDEVEASGKDGPLATATARARGFAHLDLLLEEGTDEGLLVSAQNGARGEGDGTGALQVGQALLVPTARIRLMGPYEAVALSAFSPEIAWCVTAAGVAVYRIDQPAAPRILQRIDEPDVRGVFPLSGGRLLTWGLHGLRLRHRAERRALTLSSDPVVDVVCTKGQLFALMPESVAAYDDRQQVIRTWPRPGGATLLGCTARGLVLGSTRGLFVYDRREEDSTRVVAEVDVADAVALVATDSVSRDNEIVVRRHDGSSLVLDLSEPAEPRQAARVVQDRWSAARRLGKIVARPSEDGSLLELYRLDRRLFLNRMQIEEGLAPRNRAQWPE